MAHAERCPICGGSGKLEWTDRDNTGIVPKKDCHGCDGKGWIVVSDGDDGDVVPLPKGPDPFKRPWWSPIKLPVWCEYSITVIDPTVWYEE